MNIEVMGRKGDLRNRKMREAFRWEAIKKTN